MFDRPGDREQVRNLAILLTDGRPEPQDRRVPALREALALQNLATVIAVGVTDQIDRQTLQAFSSGVFFSSPDFQALKHEVLSRLLQEVCQTPSPSKQRRAFLLLHVYQNAHCILQLL